MMDYLDHIQKQEAIRLWFEFYKLALQSSEHAEEIEGSRAFYVDWGDVMSVDFDAWWDEKKGLFAEPEAIYIGDPKNFPLPQDEDILWVAIPRNFSVKKVLDDLTVILPAELGQPGSKHQSVSKARFRLTLGKEVRVDTLGGLLVVYRDLYLKLDQPPINEAFLGKIHKWYRSRPKTIKIPAVFGSDRGLKIDEGFESHLTLVRRYIRQAKRLVANAAKGEFPGNYA